MGRYKINEDHPVYGMDNKDLIWRCLHCKRAECNNCVGSTCADVRAWIREEARQAREEYEKEHGIC
uniref:Uncharacterized protein n=1 Tax=Siphoviridae sp. ct5co22 TaxID=2826294 RepID=A0A8S5QUS0_9CAUD|nr:MAG TPA: hypothetical protein [Siphoviridae sp. ct5co22]